MSLLLLIRKPEGLSGLAPSIAVSALVYFLVLFFFERDLQFLRLILPGACSTISKNPEITIFK